MKFSRHSLQFSSSMLAAHVALTAAIVFSPEPAWSNSGTIGSITIGNGTIGAPGCTTITSDTVISTPSGCITWQGGNLSIAATGGVSEALTAIGGSPTGGNLTNSGRIGGVTNGIENNGTIGAITNSGVISGLSIGITNNGIIGTITNSGQIFGGHFGIVNPSGTIGMIINSGTIVGIDSGILNDDSIGTIINSGVINIGTVGIGADSGAGAIINSGTISGSNEGISAGGTLGSLTNSGLIEAPHAFYSSGIILSAISNSGTIEGDIGALQALTITGGSASAPGILTGYNGTIATITAYNNLTFDAHAFQLLDDDIYVGASNTVFNNGALRVNTTHSITGNYTQGPGGTLVIGVTDATHYGDLIISGAVNMAHANISLVANPNVLKVGESFTVVQAAGAADYSGITVSAYDFSTSETSITSNGYNDLIVTLSPGHAYQSIGGTSGSNSSVLGVVLDQLHASGNSNFNPLLSALDAIGTQQGMSAESAAIKQLAPGQLSASVGATNLTAIQTMTVIGQHQQNLRSLGESPTGRSSGSEYSAGALWMQISGGFANSTTAGAGFHQSYYGLTFGADDHITQNVTLGLAIGWSHNSAQGANELSGDSVTTSTPEFMGYGTYHMGQAYLNGMLGAGYNMFDQTRPIGFLNSVASSKYDGMQYMGNLETGYDFAVTPTTTMTPLAGFNAVRTDTNGYTETGAGPANTSVGHQIVDSYSTVFGGRVAMTVPTVWGSFKPDLKLAWEHDLNGSPISSNATLGGVSFATTTPRAAQDGADVALGATLQRNDNFSLRAEYDGDLRTDFQSHAGLLKGEWKF